MLKQIALLLVFSGLTSCTSGGGSDNVNTPTGGAPATGGVTAGSGGDEGQLSSGGSGAGGQPGTGGQMEGGGGQLGAGGTGTASGGQGSGGASGGMEWLPSWATTIQNTEPSNLPPALGGNTLRQFVWPTVAGGQIRLQLSNEKGTTPVQIQKVHIAMAKTAADAGNSNGQIDTSTDQALTFGGMPSVTIPAGETVWSDAADFALQEIKLTAITMQFGSQVPTEITGHPGARTTSYVASGDGVSSEALAGAQTRDRWYFINAIEVMAPTDAYAIAVLGDSITDGYGVLNVFARWPDFMTLAIQEDGMLAGKRSVLNFGMGANNLTKSDTYQDAGVVRFERDVLSRDKIKWLIVMEGVNDIEYSSVQAQPIIDAYQQIITKAHEKGILVYGSPITPMGENNTVRNTVNEWIRTSGAYDAVIDFDMVIRDPGNAHSIASMYNNDGLHPSLAGYEAMGESVDLSLFYQTAP